MWARLINPSPIRALDQSTSSPVPSHSRSAPYLNLPKSMCRQPDNVARHCDRQIALSCPQFHLIHHSRETIIQRIQIYYETPSEQNPQASNTVDGTPDWPRLRLEPKRTSMRLPVWLRFGAAGLPAKGRSACERSPVVVQKRCGRNAVGLHGACSPIARRPQRMWDYSDSGGFRKRTPAPPPFSGMNSMPAASNAAFRRSTVATFNASPRSNRVTV